jgi:hypothetical protein
LKVAREKLDQSLRRRGRAKDAIRPLRHTVIEGVDNVLFEVIAARISGHHAKHPLFVKLIEGDPENVHFDAGGDECKHRFYVRECPCADRSGRRTGRPVWNGDRKGRAPCRESTPLSLWPSDFDAC